MLHARPQEAAIRTFHTLPGQPFVVWQTTGSRPSFLALPPSRPRYVSVRSTRYQRTSAPRSKRRTKRCNRRGHKPVHLSLFHAVATKVRRPSRKVQRGLRDVNTVLGCLEPDEADPDASVPTVAVLAALSCCPSLRRDHFHRTSESTRHADTPAQNSLERILCLPAAPSAARPSPTTCSRSRPPLSWR